ncbi:ArsR family transcriptional regulator [Candidatus Woesearchaeota archaeon]|nr:ArsR family transcriptional regulator [Candidatus Woesearchaeota archaeon]
MTQKVTILRIRRVATENLNQDLQWFGSSLGLFNLRDKDSSCFRVFITLLKRARTSDLITSDEVAEKLDLSRGTVVHHLTKLMDAGIVMRVKGGYVLRDNNLQKVIRDVQRDIENIFTDLNKVAKEIDDQLGQNF